MKRGINRIYGLPKKNGILPSCFPHGYKFMKESFFEIKKVKMTQCKLFRFDKSTFDFSFCYGI